MRRRRPLLVVAVGVATLAFAGCGGSDNGSTDTTDTDTTATDTTETTTQGTTLIATVGPGFDISLKSEQGDDITSLTPSTYTIEVDDTSSAHNFHLTGPGVDQSTEVDQVEQQTWTVDFQPGTYTFVCDPHASSMKGSFEVT